MQDEDWNVERKADNSPLTRADQEANAVICAGLAALGTSAVKTTLCLSIDFQALSKLTFQQLSSKNRSVDLTDPRKGTKFE